MTASKPCTEKEDVIFFDSLRGRTFWAEWIRERGFFYVGASLFYTEAMPFEEFSAWARKRNNLIRYGSEVIEIDQPTPIETEASSDLNDRKSAFLSLFKEGATLRDIADHLGCDMKTFYRWAAADRTFAFNWAQLKKAR